MLVCYWRWKMRMFGDAGTLVTVDYWRPAQGPGGVGVMWNGDVGAIVSSRCMYYIQKETMMWCRRLNYRVFANKRPKVG